MQICVENEWRSLAPAEDDAPDNVDANGKDGQRDQRPDERDHGVRDMKKDEEGDERHQQQKYTLKAGTTGGGPTHGRVYLPPSTPSLRTSSL